MITVLVPLDGSEAAERAVGVAGSLALHLGAELVLVRSSWDTSEIDVAAYHDDVLERFELAVSAAGKVIDRYPADALHDIALDYDEAVLCLASHGRTGLGHALLGSFGEEILARSGVPAFVVGPKATAGSLDDTAVGHRIGWCVDAATDVAAVGPFCAQWASRLHRDVDVLTVRAEDDRPISRFHPAPSDRLDEAVASLEAHGVRAAVTELEELLPARRLARFAADHRLALLIASKRSGTGLTRDVLGSTSMNLVHLSPCPVLFPPVPGEGPADGAA